MENATSFMYKIHFNEQELVMRMTRRSKTSHVLETRTIKMMPSMEGFEISVNNTIKLLT
jgi:hypothetical protein